MNEIPNLIGSCLIGRLKHAEDSLEVLLVVANDVFRMGQGVVVRILLQLDCSKHTRNVTHLFFVFQLWVDDRVFYDHKEFVLLKAKLVSDLLP